ncbi:MAG: hypothetical protein IKT43_00210 [Clostridia bacterium]|nr:hypothetical protein [Clostridia bacterium]
MQSTSKRIFLKDVLAEEDRAEELEAYIESVVSSRVEEKVKAVLRAEYMRGYADGLKVAEDGGGKRLLEIPIEDLDLSTRSFNCLKRSGVNKMGDFLLYDTKESIMGIKSLGKNAPKKLQPN